MIRDGMFSLPGRKAPLKSDKEYEVILVYATESPINDLKKQKRYYSGKEMAYPENADTGIRSCTNRLKPIQ